LEQVLGLPVADRTELLHEISGSLVAFDEVSPHLSRLLDERLEDLEVNPDDWAPGDRVIADLRDRFAR
jgi:hypothetical protein